MSELRAGDKVLIAGVLGKQPWMSKVLRDESARWAYVGAKNGNNALVDLSNVFPLAAIQRLIETAHTPCHRHAEGVRCPLNDVLNDPSIQRLRTLGREEQ